MCNHINNLSTPDLITALSSDVLIDTTVIFVEADDVKKDIMEGIFSVSNLMGLEFLDSNRQVVKNPASIDVKDCTKDLAHLLLSCTIDASKMDDRINQETLCLGYYYTLTQNVSKSMILFNQNTKKRFI